MDRCLNCQFYDRHDGKLNDGKAATAGQCRRAAPALSPINAKSYMIEGVWPTVRDDDWCGEWKALVRRIDPTRLGAVREVPGATAIPPRSPVRDPAAPARSGPVNLLTPVSASAFGAPLAGAPALAAARGLGES